jgi:sugar/nucleoside kinase (ribokinase family)
MGPNVDVAMRGNLGSIALEGERYESFGVIDCNVVDTMGAGDAFATAMLVTLCENLLPMREGRAVPSGKLQEALPIALRAAAAFSAKTCLKRGAFGDGMPVPESMRERIYAETL